MKTLRKGTKVKLLNPDETWGEYFTVHKKEKDFVYLVSDNKPEDRKSTRLNSSH